MAILEDVRYGVRMLVSKPGFTAAAVSVLALGIGANTAIFSLVNAFLLRPLHIGNPNELVGVYSRDTQKPDSYRAFSYPNYADLRDNNPVFAGLAAHNLAMVGFSEGDSTRRIFADIVSSNYFDTLGVSLLHGRTFTLAEERPGSAIPVAIESYSFWQKNGADPEIIGKSLRINARIYTVIGITQEGFTGTTALVSPSLYLPLGMYEAAINDFEGQGRQLAAHDNHNLILIGRLRPGMTQTSADHQLSTVASRLEQAFPKENKNQALIVRPLSRMSISTNPGNDSQLVIPATLLLAVAGVVLLIASLNVANMMLARGTARRKEIAIRLSLGGSRRNILQQLFLEGLVLALAGGAAGLAIAYWGTTALVRSLATLAPIDIVYNGGPDVRVLLATIGFCIFSTLLFGLGPAVSLSKRNILSGLKDGDHEDVDSGKPRRLFARRNILVMSQISLSLVLLTAAGLFVRSSMRAEGVDPGFQMDNGVVAEIDPSLAGYSENKGREVYRALLDRLGTIPGVESASIAASVPFGMLSLGRGIQRSTDDSSNKSSFIPAGFNIVSENYFKTLGIPLVRGRYFQSSESNPKSSPVVILDKLAAERLWPNGDPIGKRIRMSREGGSAPLEAEVVGVVRDIQDRIVGADPRPHLYALFGQEYQADMNIHLKVAMAGPEAEARVLETVRREIRSADDRVPVLELKTMRGHLDSSFDIWIVRTGARMFGIFGSVALLLAMIGLYGVRAYAVARRTREIGIRMALGAKPADALGMILREGLIVTAIGVAAGLLLSLGVGKVLSSILYQARGFDPLVLAGAPATLALVSLLACYVPARRAAHVDPMVALRHE
jgi:predicted permease